MKSEEWKSYRTRFLVNAKQLNSSLSFVDQLGRQHCGRKGDYLVESSDGVISIAPRRIFEDIYVPMPQQDEPGRAEVPLQETLLPERMTCQSTTCQSTTSTSPTCTSSDDNFDLRRFEPLQIAEIGIEQMTRNKRGRQRIDQSRNIDDPTPTSQRKSPQPCRDRRSSASRLGLM
jgi:hypothetical protein